MPKEVYAEPANAANTEREVHFGDAFESFNLFLGHETVGDVLGFLRGEFAVFERMNSSVHTKMGYNAGLDKKVGCLLVCHFDKEIVQLNREH